MSLSAWRLDSLSAHNYLGNSIGSMNRVTETEAAVTARIAGHGKWYRYISTMTLRRAFLRPGYACVVTRESLRRDSRETRRTCTPCLIRTPAVLKWRAL